MHDPMPSTVILSMQILQPWKTAFPNVEIRGCLFHLSQNLLKQIKSSDLRGSNNNNPDFPLQAELVTALSFVLNNDTDRHVDALALALCGEVVPLLNWFEDNYIGRPYQKGTGRRQPLFPTKMWNTYQRTLQGEDVTNNHAEAASRRLRGKLGMLHPTIWHFIDALKWVQKGQNEYFENFHLAMSLSPNYWNTEK